MKKHAVICFGVVFLFLCSLLPSVGSVPVSPDQPGPYHIGSYKIFYFGFPYGFYQAVIRYPADTDGSLVPINLSGEPYPCVVVANGLLGSEYQITWISEHLTSYGYVTLCFTPPHRFSFDATQWTTGILKGFTVLHRQNEKEASPLYHMLDVETCGAIGLSMGGGGCVEATGAANSVIDASVALAPASFASVRDAAQNINVPIQLQVGTVDGIVPPESVLSLYVESLSNFTTKEYLAITGGNHIGFIDEYYAEKANEMNIDNPPGISVEQQHNVSCRYFTAWFQYHLRGLDEYYPYIFGDEAAQDLQSGVLSDFRFNIP
jgi:dienelactone hydrolase